MCWAGVGLEVRACALRVQDFLTKVLFKVSGHVKVEASREIAAKEQKCYHELSGLGSL